MKASFAASIVAFAATAIAGPAASMPPNFSSLMRRATLPIPASNGTTTVLKEAMQVTGSFDGGLKTFDRGVSCSGQAEGGDSDAVFILDDGATLENVIIGKNQIEGVHCLGSCTIKNVWWVAVCEDALSFKGDGNGMVIGGGATGASDKVIQHNGAGTITIDGFTADGFGKLYRSCGNCKKSAKREVIMKGVKASNGKTLVGINPNFGDTATIDSATCATGVDTICQEFVGTTPGNEPKASGDGVPSEACNFTAPLKSC